MKVYIAGPMTGYVDHNFDAFHRAAARLREVFGYEVVNPAELDGDTPHEVLRQIPHHVFLKRDIAVLLDCDAIYFLPGWTHSKGACLESTVARGCGIPEIVDPDLDLWRTLEGEPLIEESEPEVALPDATADGYEWPPLCTEQTCSKHGEANCRGAEDEQDRMAEVIVLHATRPEGSLAYRGHSAPQPGDSFPNVAYVRDMTGRTAAELAEVARQSFASEQFVRGTE